jgi:branched chain amino acid efflux pump
VLGTATGVLVGGTLGDAETLGLDAIFPAFFLALIASELARPCAIAAIVIGGALAIVLTPSLPPGLPVLLASAGSLIGLIR